MSIPFNLSSLKYAGIAAQIDKDKCQDERNP